MTLRITIENLDAGTREVVELKPGGFLLTCAEPCHLAYVQAHRNGTQVLTVKEFDPDAVQPIPGADTDGGES